MLTNITLKFGNSLEEKLQFDVQPINIIVGPNNSGKSLFLNELKYHLSNFNPSNTMIVDELQVNNLTEKDARAIVEGFENIPGRGEIYIPSTNNSPKLTANTEELFLGLTNYDTSHIQMKRTRICFYEGQSTLLLNGQTRLNSLNWQNYVNLKNNGTVPTIKKFIDSDRKMNDLTEFIYDAFNLYPEIELKGNEARLVLSKEKISEELRLSIKPKAKEFFKRVDSSDTISDGRKAYIGIISEIVAGNPSIISLDEPEAFLHPPLARKLGKVISKIAATEKKQLFISTHSSDFIMGCVESSVPINIIRLTHQDDKSTATLIDNDTLSEMMKNPLLRSTNVLSGIFYKNVIITEGDSDRAFYQEINNRLKDFKPEWSIEDCLFLNAQNKQTVGSITSTLRKIGIPSISLVDFDFIKDGGKVFTDYLYSVNIPQVLHSSISDKKTKVKDGFPKKDDGKYANNSEIKTMGIKYLKIHSPRDLFPLAESLLKEIAEYGFFAVPNGELESWLPNVPVTGHGNQWLTDKFESMGSDPESSNYVKPSDDDVWVFMKQIKDWLDNPNRKGI